MFVQGIPLRVSPETTFITEPLDETGKWVDYFRAIEYHQQFHDLTPVVLRCPGANGYAVIVDDHAPFQPGTGQKSDARSKETLLIVERKDEGNWMRPDNEIPQSEAELGINKNPGGIGGSHPEECRNCGNPHGNGCN